MALPETIPIRYTEEEAEYLSVRPVVRQTFRQEELLDMILRVTGKDVARVQQILRAGSVVYHAYRYWWNAIEVDETELRAALGRYPDADPARAFRAADCAAVLLESSGAPGRHPIEISRQEGSQKKLFRRRSFWDALMTLAAEAPLDYEGYSYERCADLFRLYVSEAQVRSLANAVSKLARRELGAKLARLPQLHRIVFVCPRGENVKQSAGSHVL
jgi:hypothetical protein